MLSKLGRVLREQAKYDEALEVHQRVLQLRNKGLAQDHRLTLVTRGNIAAVLSDQGKYEEAEGMARILLQDMTQHLGPEDSETLISMNNLAHVLVEQEKYEEAEKLHSRALRIKERLYGWTPLTASPLS